MTKNNWNEIIRVGMMGGMTNEGLFFKDDGTIEVIDQGDLTWKENKMTKEYKKGSKKGGKKK